MISTLESAPIKAALLSKFSISVLRYDSNRNHYRYHFSLYDAFKMHILGKKYNEKHSLCSLQSGHSQHLAKWIILKVSWFQKLKPRGMIFQNYRILALEFRKNEWWKSKQGMIWWKGGSLSCHYYSLVHSPHLSIGTNMQFQTCHYRNILKSCNGDSQSFPNFVIWNYEKVTLLMKLLFSC